MRKRERETERRGDRETERQRDRETERQRDRETERQRDRETGGQGDREAERQRDRETERQRKVLPKHVTIKLTCAPCRAKTPYCAKIHCCEIPEQHSRAVRPHTQQTSQPVYRPAALSARVPA